MPQPQLQRAVARPCRARACRARTLMGAERVQSGRRAGTDGYRAGAERVHRVHALGC